MLYPAAVFPDTLSLLKKLMKLEDLADFNLAGGTALAIQIGHRFSYDLDFFGNSPLSIHDILITLGNNFEFREIHQTKNILVIDVNNVKVDFVKYKYPLIGDLHTKDEIRMLSVEDIAAMKLDAIKGRGRKRDFYDIYFLLQKYDLLRLLELHLKKFKEDTSYQIIKSLIYFDDAEIDAPVKLLGPDLSWEKVKEFILRKVDTAL